MTGSMIVFEGLDKAGKKTQSELLVAWLQKHKKRAIRVEIPDYSTPTGIEIREYLNGNRDFSAREAQLLYIINRYEVMGTIRELLNEYDFVVVDRYSLSGLAYGEAQEVDVALLKRLQAFLITPNLGFFLDISASVSLSRKHRHMPDDILESDLKLLERTEAAYQHLAQDYNYIRIDGMLSPEAIHNRIQARMREFFNIK